MEADLDTLATALYVRTDDLLKACPERAPWRPAVGITPKITDAELITLAPSPRPSSTSRSRREPLPPVPPFVAKRTGQPVGDPETAGTARVEVAGSVEVTSAFQPRTRELLVLLAVHPDGVTREALTAALWPDSPPERITNALNTGLSRLRRATRTATRGTLGDIVPVGHGRFRLDPSLVAVDYQRFVEARHARDAHRAAGEDPQRQAAVRAMIDTYVGPFAEGMSAEWIETLRESLRREVLDALAALARARVGADPEEALQLLEIACGLDPHNELRYCDIMRLQARLGRREAIPPTLAVLTARLVELGEQPDPEVIELAHRLTHPHSPARATAGSAATSHLDTDPRPDTR